MDLAIVHTAMTVVLAMVSFFSLGCALWAIIEVKALKASTHKIQYVPAPTPDDFGDPLRSGPTPNVTNPPPSGGFENISEETRDRFRNEDALDFDMLHDDGTAAALRPDSLQSKATEI